MGPMTLSPTAGFFHALSDSRHDAGAFQPQYRVADVHQATIGHEVLEVQADRVDAHLRLAGPRRRRHPLSENEFERGHGANRSRPIAGVLPVGPTQVLAFRDTGDESAMRREGRFRPPGLRRRSPAPAPRFPLAGDPAQIDQANVELRSLVHQHAHEAADGSLIEVISPDSATSSAPLVAIHRSRLALRERHD